MGSPKGVLRACFQAELMDEQQARLALAMVDDRNLTTHTYNEALATRIYGLLGTYQRLMSACVHAALDKAEIGH